MAKKQARAKQVAPRKTVASTAAKKAASKKSGIKKSATKKSAARKTPSISHEKPPATKREAAALARAAMREGSRSNTVSAKRGNRRNQPITEPMEKADISRGRQQSAQHDEPYRTVKKKKLPHRRRAALRD